MLTDIFSRRYSEILIWKAFDEPTRRLLVQCFKLITEQICPFYYNGREVEAAKSFWNGIHSLLSMELGLQSLSPLAYSYQSSWQGQPHNNSGIWPIITVCENWMLASLSNSDLPDTYVKDRISFVELCFRKRAEQIATINAEFPSKLKAAKLQQVRRGGLYIPGDITDGITSINTAVNKSFEEAVKELSTRFVQAGCNLHYHNGIVQQSTDPLLRQEIETPFWKLVADPKWKNVDQDMKEAFDRKGSLARDPAFYALRALESTLKIISGDRGLSSGSEKGAHNYIDNLGSSRAMQFIKKWEVDQIKGLFTEIRNPLGHGPGSAPMPTLSSSENELILDICLSWIKCLIFRS